MELTEEVPSISYRSILYDGLLFVLSLMILTGNDFDQMTGIMRANVQCS